MLENQERKNMGKNKQYIGPFEVMGMATIPDYKTPSGGEVIHVSFKDKQSAEIMTRKAFDEFVSDKPVDLTTFRDKLTDVLVVEISKAIMEYNLKHIDIQHLMTVAGNKLIDAFDRAGNLLWTGDDNQWVPGSSFLNSRTLLEADMILKSKKIHDKKSGGENKS